MFGVKAMEGSRCGGTAFGGMASRIAKGCRSDDNGSVAINTAVPYNGALKVVHGAKRP
jgi:hypothetical protein